MVRDIILDVKESDVLLDDKSSVSEPTFDVEWDGSTCKVMIPVRYTAIVAYTDGVFSCRVKIPYKPLNANFNITVYVNGVASSITGGAAQSYLYGATVASPIKASQLPMIDIDGGFRLIFKEGASHVNVYSSKESDLLVGYSDNQAAQLLALCAPGKNYRYPTTGVDITKYLNTVVENTDLRRKIQEQYEADGKVITSAEFDSETGELQTTFNAETEQDDDVQLTDVEDLDTDFLSKFTDEYIRTELNLEKSDVFGFANIYDYHENFLALLYFLTQDVQWEIMDDSHASGQIDEDGETIENNDYYVVVASVKAGTVLVFNMPSVTENDNPVFFLDDHDVTDEYLTLSRTPEFYEAPCYNCSVVLKDCTLKYSIPKTAFDASEGIYALKEVSTNINNLMAISRDGISGRILGIVSKTTNVDDATLNDVVEVYATIYTDYDE